jgi:acetylornithine deacetylase
MQYLYDVLSQLVSADTVSHKSNAAAMELLAEHLDGQGFSVRLQHDEQEGVRKTNLVAFAGPPEPDGLILSGHLDVVPFEDQPGWSRDPLRMTVEDDRIYGRGTTDMKGFIAQCLEAARRVETRSLERPIVFLFTSDEEVGCRGAERLVPALPNRGSGSPHPSRCFMSTRESSPSRSASSGWGDTAACRKPV